IVDRCEVVPSLSPRNRHKTLRPIAMADDICDSVPRFAESSQVRLLARLSCVEVLTALTAYSDSSLGTLARSRHRERIRSRLQKGIRQVAFAGLSYASISEIHSWSETHASQLS